MRANPQGMYGMYGMYGATTKLAKLYNVGQKYDAASIKKLGELISAMFPQPSQLLNTQEDIDTVFAMTENTDGKYTAAMSKLVKKIQPELGFTGDSVDGKVGPNTWRKLGAADAEIPAASSGGGSSSSGGSSSGGSSSGGSSDGKFELSSITEQVWFWPATGVVGLGLLVIILKAMKKKKKKGPNLKQNRLF